MAADTEISNYGYLQIVNSNFSDLVSHYINMWQAYNQSFTQVAMVLCLWGGLAWVSVLTLKAPVDRLKTASSAAGVVLLVGMLLQPGHYNIGPAGGSVGLSAGAGWSLRIVGNIYQLFKSALDSVNKESAMEVAFENAYHVTDEGTLKRFIDSPVYDMYKDYIGKCQPALISTAGAQPDTRSLGKYVGLFGSTGINPVEVTQMSEDTYNELLKGNKTDSQAVQAFGSVLPWKAYQEAKSNAAVAENVDKARAMLAAIPEDANPFKGSKKYYLMPSEEYWVRQNWPEKKTEGKSEYEKYSSGKNGEMYRNPELADNSTVPTEQEVRYYPKDCLQMYGMVQQAVSNLTTAIQFAVPNAKQSAYMRDGVEAQDMMIKQIQAQAEAQEKKDNLPIPLFGGDSVGWTAKDTVNSIVTKIQDVGKVYREWMLTFKIPSMINGCAMLVGILVVLFPVICVFGVFVNPSILISYVKLICFGFMVPLVNNLCLTMAATLLAMNGELMTGLTAGNFGENNTLLISASNAQYIIFMALTAVEIVIAKMLIWDDVKGLSGFNPAGAATGMAATGGAVIGTVVKLGSTAMNLMRGPGKILGAAANARNATPGAGGGGTGGAYPSSIINVRLPAPSSASYSSTGSKLSKSPKPPALPPPGSAPGGPGPKP
ncbi:hypothetical protein [Pseudomonas asiatica]|uniref:hypothetical protein n=1 Tax=Pseudomonas asiatica TaxID=2219225 RepID=UPI0010BF8740|nr:hypothetical protein [Pseudomonas asiatica]